MSLPAGWRQNEPGGSSSEVPDLSILIVNWNTHDLLADCLASIQANQDGLRTEVIVVDNASTDGSPEMVRQCFPWCHLIVNPENGGFAHGSNQAIAASRGRHIALLNSDTLVLPGALERLVRFLDIHPEVGIVGARLLNGDGSLQPSWAEFPSIRSEVLGKNFRTRSLYPSRSGLEAYRVDWVGGACLVMRREALDQVGPMDEGYFMYSEELDWCYRTRQTGWQICYLPAAQVIHYGGQSTRKASFEMKTELFRSKLIFFSKHYPPWKGRLLSVLLQFVFITRGVIETVSSALSPDTRQSSQVYQEYIALARAMRENGREKV